MAFRAPRRENLVWRPPARQHSRNIRNSLFTFTRQNLFLKKTQVNSLMQNWQKLFRSKLSWDKLFYRERVIRAVLQFFHNRKFHEIETPCLIPYPAAESYLEVFQTTLYDRYRNPRTMFLSTSPETCLKKLLVAGVGNCYSLTKSFRNA